MQLKRISIEAIELRPGNPRSTFATESLQDLEKSLKRDGFIQPIVVRPKGSKYELIVGERRVRAALRANISKIDVLIRENLSDEEADRLRLIENIQRDELTLPERIKGIEAHMQRHSIRTLKEAALDLNLDPKLVESWFSVAKNVPAAILEKDAYVRRLGFQKLNEIKMFDDRTQEKLAEQIYNSNMTVDELRRFIRLFKSNPDADLKVLAKKAQEQVKTIEVTLPIEEAKALEKRAKEFARKEEVATKKLQKIRRKPKSKTEIEKDIAAGASVTRGLTRERVPISGFSMEKLRDRQITNAILDAGLNSEEVKLLTLLKKDYPQDSPQQLVERVKERTRIQPLVLELQPDLFQALKRYAKSRGVTEKQAVIRAVEDILAEEGLWKRVVSP